MTRVFHDTVDIDVSDREAADSMKLGCWMLFAVTVADLVSTSRGLTGFLVANAVFAVVVAVVWTLASVSMRHVVAALVWFTVAANAAIVFTHCFATY